MCLETVNTRTVNEEGYGYKMYRKEGDILVSPIMKFSVIHDEWLYYKEPSCNVQCGFNYEHGFHLLKATSSMRFFLGGFGRTYNCAEAKSYSNSIYRNLMKNFILKRVYYKGYIAEDDDQIVAKTIYVPTGTMVPKEFQTEISHELVGVMI